ncbi:ABC transporter substrate-binding protein [Intrasporangium calvum]|uniref:ABC transporter substrate-binding protein n=1 Tax=Intrasporangium calvum TaxID=53358 RepID=A0ABT5GKT9_9MICO|nr:ABC transporter substrate-binding protein [Intrasporangium calvum]MDC5698839.1 ABC transporter substrate-binding protein [Intrasporangium calvum]
MAALAIALPFSLAACAPAMPGSDAAPDGTTKVVVAPSSEMSAAWVQFAVAEDQGFFAENGIDVEVQWPGGSADVLQQLATGRVHVGAPTPEAVLAARSKGQDVQMIYNWSRSPVQWLAVTPESGIKSFADLRDKKVGVANLASGAKLLAEAAARDEGIEPSAINFIATGTGVAALDALQQKRVDALMLWDTEYTKMEQAGGKLRYIKPDSYSTLFSTTFVGQADWVSKNPKLVEAFGKAWAQATVWATKNPEGAVNLLWKHYPQTKTSDSPDLLTKQVQLFEGRNESALSGDPIARKTLGEYPADGVAKWADFALKAQITPNKVDSDRMYTNQFVQAFNDFDAKAVEDRAAAFK